MAKVRRQNGKQGDCGLSSGEKRRLRQLAACVVLFVAVFAGRGIDVEPVVHFSETVGMMIREQPDLRSVFVEAGESFSQGEPAVETFRALWDGVFGDGAPTEESKEPEHEVISPFPSEEPKAATNEPSMASRAEAAKISCPFMV